MTDGLRYLELIPASADGLVVVDQLPEPLPFGLEPRDVLRTVEDVHQLVHRLNTVLHQANYPPLESLLDPAGFSGLLSRTVAARLARASTRLVVNGFHNGYPDLIVDGQYPRNMVQHGEGLEVKASRSDSNWQSHGPRGGWFVWVQFALDERDAVAVFDREPTQIQAVMAAQLTTDDWSWQPAAAGRIRSGTASVTASGKAKLRAGAIWVAPTHLEQHRALLGKNLLDSFRASSETTVLTALAGSVDGLTVSQAAELIAPIVNLEAAAIVTRVQAAFARLRKKGLIVHSGRGLYRRA